MNEQPVVGGYRRADHRLVSISFIVTYDRGPSVRRDVLEWLGILRRWTFEHRIASYGWDYFVGHGYSESSNGHCCDCHSTTSSSPLLVRYLPPLYHYRDEFVVAVVVRYFDSSVRKHISRTREGWNQICSRGGKEPGDGIVCLSKKSILR